MQGFDDQKLKKKIQLKKYYLFFVQKLQFYLSQHPRPPLQTSKLQEKPSALKREHPALQKMKFIDSLLFSWVSFALLDPDTIESGRVSDPH